MSRILFVDDEQAVLDGLQNMLHTQRRVWNMVFALGGQAALDEMAKAPFDALVSDMRMPGMDGAELLTQVKRLYPATARIILSGHAEHGMVSRAMPVSHQFLSKPCDADTLRGVIERTAGLCKMLGDPLLRERVGEIEMLPSLPELYWELDRAVRDLRSSTATVAEIMERDPAMCAKVLQIVNSAYFGLAQPMTSVSKAVAYLGVDLIKGLTLATRLFSIDESFLDIPGFSLASLQEHSLLTGRLAEQFVEDSIQREDALLAGLVHDVGKLVLARVMPEAFAESIRVAAESQRPDFLVEKELLGVGHAEMGAYLLSLWGLPFRIVEAVAFHHELPEQLEARAGLGIAAVHVADVLAHRASGAAAHFPAADQVDAVALERLGLTAELARWEDIAASAAERRQAAA